MALACRRGLVCRRGRFPSVFPADGYDLFTCSAEELGFTRFRDVTFGTGMLSLQERQSLLHEGLMILEDAPVSGVLIEDEFGIGQAARQIDRVAAGHHHVLIAIRHQHRLTDRDQILGA